MDAPSPVIRLVHMLAIVAYLLVIGVVLVFATFGSSSVCDCCGCTQSKLEFQIPFTSITYWERRQIEPSPLSLAGEQLGLMQPHAHQWVFIHGSGHGIACALGNGYGIRSAAKAPEVVAFISATHQFRDREEAVQWLQIALDIRKSEALREWVFDFPTKGLTTKEEYEQWRTNNDSQWPEILSLKNDR